MCEILFFLNYRTLQGYIPTIAYRKKKYFSVDFYMFFECVWAEINHTVLSATFISSAAKVSYILQIPD